MAQDRPNIVMIVGEDTGRHQGCYGDPVARTPNIDRLASEGARYTNAFAHSPVCAPSRSGLVAGRYPISFGSHHMRSKVKNPPRLFTHELRDAGYFVDWHTKTDFNFEPPADFADSTESWYDNFPREPFFAFVNLGMTHESAGWRDEEKHDELLREEGIAERTDPASVPVPPYLPDTEETRHDLAKYYDSLAVQDVQVGRVLESIDRHNLRDNTVVMYLTDHGRGLPREKRWPYDAGIHLPLIVRWPGELDPGEVRDELVAWVDLAPTVLALAGAPIPSDYPGRVFLGDDVGPARDYVYAHRDRMDECFDRVRVVRSKRYHYIRNYYPELPWAQRLRYMEQEATLQRMRAMRREGTLTGAPALFLQDSKPAEELYDIERDPETIHNLAGDSQYEPVLEEMRAALDDWLTQVGDLGEVSEETLVERGIVEDQIEEYRSRVSTLEPADQLGPYARPVVTKQEHEQASAEAR